MPIRIPADPPIVEVPVTQALWRVHRREHDPLWFGPGAGRPRSGRFDAPAGEYGVCYFGATLGVALLETLVRGQKVPIIARAALEIRAASALAPARPLRMLQLEGKGLSSFGLSAHAITGDDVTECRDVALRVHETVPDVDGVQYRSRWDNSELCWAIFDRARTGFNAVLGTYALDNPAVVRPALIPYRHVSIS